MHRKKFATPDSLRSSPLLFQQAEIHYRVIPPIKAPMWYFDSGAPPAGQSFADADEAPLWPHKTPQGLIGRWMRAQIACEVELNVYKSGADGVRDMRPTCNCAADTCKNTQAGGRSWAGHVRQIWQSLQGLLGSCQEPGTKRRKIWKWFRRKIISNWNFDNKYDFRKYPNIFWMDKHLGNIICYKHVLWHYLWMLLNDV